MRFNRRTILSGAIAVVPYQPEKSVLLKRIFTQDPDEIMPPPSVKHPLSEAQREILRRWIASGAVYQDHWAFVAPQQAALPVVRNRAWSRGAIDHFILAKLEAEGLEPSPEADRATLVRRLSLDLIGLPPTIEEADAFINDAAADAYPIARGSSS